MCVPPIAARALNTLGDNLQHIGTVVAWGSKESGVARLHVWVQPQ